MRGFDWGTSPGNYTGSWTEGASGNYQFGTGSFSYNLTGLSPGQTYYFRAKAHNSAGWGYGSEMSFYLHPMNSWRYRRPITISNSGSALTNYQVLVTLDTQSLISAGKMRSDCGDIRFTDSDTQTLLSYWLESGCNTNSTKIWIKVPSIPSGSKTIYVYYGNSSATSASNFSATFPNSYILSSGSATIPGGTLNYDWFEIKSGTTLYLTSSQITTINARVIKIAGTIDGTGKGYGASSGPGAGGSGGRGGGYGGVGGCPGSYCSCSGGGSYGTSNGEDIDMGSGGGNSCCSPSGSGGGAIALNGSRVVEVAGTIKMDGTAGANCNCNAPGGGAGGGILIKGREVYLSGATLRAVGGNGGSDTYNDCDNYGVCECGGGGGAGGRIKIFYSAYYSAPASMLVSGGSGGIGYGGGNGQAGGAGTTNVGTFSSPEPTTSVGAEEYVIGIFAKIILDTASLISRNLMRSDCGDVRFTDSRSFDSALWSRNFSYYLASGCNSSSTVFYVNASAINPDIGKTFYIYYGNPGVTSISAYPASIRYWVATLLPQETWIRFSGVLIGSGSGGLKIQ